MTARHDWRRFGMHGPEAREGFRARDPMSAYIISDGEFYKVGVSRQPAKRLSALQTATPRHLQLIRSYSLDRQRAFQLERLARRYLADQQKAAFGREWFAANPGVLAAVDHLAERLAESVEQPVPDEDVATLIAPAASLIGCEPGGR